MLPNPIVALPAACRTFAVSVAELRFADVVAHARRSRAAELPGDDARWNHIVGAIGEHAFASWLGRIVDRRGTRFGVCGCGMYKGTVNTFSVGGDVGAYQVRTRRYVEASLIVRLNDKDADVFVLVVPVEEDLARARRNESPLSTIGRWQLVGWTYGEDAKQFRFITNPRDRGAAYFMPQRELMPILTLPMDERGEEVDNARKESDQANEANKARRTSETGRAVRR